MRLSGGAISPDAVLIWTGERELTRFERSGARESFMIGARPIAAHVGVGGIVVADEAGRVHRYDVTGQRLGFVPLLESPSVIEAAAVSADGSRLAILAGEVQIFAHGQLRPWSFAHRREKGWRERGVDLSADGRAVLVRYSLAGNPEVLGEVVDGVSITRDDGVRLFRHFAQKLKPLQLAMSFDARRLAKCEDKQRVSIYETGTMTMLHRIEPAGRVSAMHFDGQRLGVLYDYQLVLYDERERRIDLPEQFDDFVFCGDDIVCIHPELGAWWIDITAPAG
jgi:hypothetical protein